MIETTVFAHGAWRYRHRPSPDCWCRPKGEDGWVGHRMLDIGRLDERERVFISGNIQAPI